MDELIEIYKTTLKQLHGDSKSDAEIDKMAREIIENRPDKEALKKSVGFAYFRGMVSEEEIENFKVQVESQGFQFLKKDKSEEVYNSLHYFFTEVVIFLGSDVTRTIILGAAGSGLWAVIKDWIKYVREKTKGEKLKLISGGKVKKEVKVVLHLKFKLDEVSVIDFDLGEEISMTELEESLNKTLVVTREESEKDIELTNTKKRYRYSHQTKKWEVVKIRKE